MNFFVKTLFMLALCQGNDLAAQNYPCAAQGSAALSALLGTWEVTAKDRTSPGNYEENTGRSTINWAIEGCSISEVYKGSFKGHAYAVQNNTYMTDSLDVARNYYDSEHGGLMSFEGNITGQNLTSLWYRDASKKRMQVKNELVWKNKNQFESITHLSTDYGKTWQLTHHWVYNRGQ